MEKKRTIFISILFMTGVVLLGIDVYGLFVPLRSPALERDFGSQISVPLEQARRILLDSDVHDRKRFVSKATHTVHDAMVHYWKDEGVDRYNMRVPLHENYILYMLSWIYPPVFRKYEFMDEEKGLERGLGLCSQHALVLSGYLNRRGIASRLVLLYGHVVAEALVDPRTNEWWILDADFGVVIPHSIQYLERHRNELASYYQGKTDEHTLRKIISYYAPPNVVLSVDYYYNSKMKTYTLRYMVEVTSYLLKWLIPILLLAWAGWLLVRRRHG